jgi:hypothetical protein
MDASHPTAADRARCHPDPRCRLGRDMSSLVGKLRDSGRTRVRMRSGRVQQEAPVIGVSFLPCRAWHHHRVGNAKGREPARLRRERLAALVTRG